MPDKRSSNASASTPQQPAMGLGDTRSGRDSLSRHAATPHQPLNPHSPLKLVTGPRRVMYLALAAVFFVLGFLGALLPILPTTPFLLLTSYLLVRSFPALNDKLLHAPLVGEILRDWQVRRGVRPH
ncbi:MAG: YbaN family protein, partial [Pirellulaceae bacterium]